MIRSMMWAAAMWVVIEVGFLIFNSTLPYWYPYKDPGLHLVLFYFCIPSGIVFAWWIKQ